MKNLKPYNLLTSSLSLFFLTLLLSSALLVAQDTARFIGLGLPSTAWDVSDDGLVVVGAANGAAFVWTENNGLTGLPLFPGSTVNEAMGVSGDGMVVVGTGYGVPNVNSKALRWVSGAVSALVPPPHTTPAPEASYVFDISADGTKIVGRGNSDISNFEAVLWSGSGVQHLGILPGAYTSRALAISSNGSVIVGDCVNLNPVYSIAFRSVGGGSLQSLGTGGYFASSARGVSYYGEVIVGMIQALQGGPGTAAKWTVTSGWQLLQGITGDSYATGVSANGNIIVGKMGGKAFVWDASSGARDLKTVLENEYHLDLTGWTLTDATAVDSSGTVIVGYGNHNGVWEAWYVKLPRLNITKPIQNSLWIAGEKDTLKWNGGKKNQPLRIEYSVDSATTFNIIDVVANGDTGMYEWDIPNDILSKKCMIRIVDMADPTIADTSDVFKIKPYILTRDSSGQYEPYRPDEDQWTFWNNQQDMFPQTWYQQFNYQSIDPFTGHSYLFALPPLFFTMSFASSFPDWVSWVRTFGIDACYFNISFPPIYSPAAVAKWFSIKRNWGGSCFGLAASNALAFSYKNQFQTKFTNFPGFSNPITVASDTAVKRVVNELFTHQFGNPSRRRTLDWNYITPNQTLNELKAMLKEDNVSPKTLSFGNNNGRGGHNILPYKVNQDPAAKNIFYLFVYDNQSPSITTIIRIDTLGNSNHGVWMPLYGPAHWGGPRKFMLMTESSGYFSNAIFPKRTAGYDSPFILSPDELEVYTPSTGNIKIKDQQGNVTGYTNGSVLDEIPNSVPLFYFDGSETPPYGYSLPDATYSVLMDNFVSDTVRTFFFSGNKTFFYHRDSAEQNQTDRFFFDGGVSVVNHDQQNKTVNLLNIINETTQEKLFAFNSVELSQNDSIKIENPDSSKIKLISYGTAKDYGLELNYVTENGIGRFGNNSVPLQANTTHAIEPEWTDITNTTLKIKIDIGNDGTIDDTLEVVNQLTGIGNIQGSVTPTEFRLEQNYPNPFNPSTTIQYSIPEKRNVVLKVYDVLGNEIVALVNEERERGIYSINFDATGLASGVYLYKLQAGSFIEIKKLMLLK